jgi:hypothetical protein
MGWRLAFFSGSGQISGPFMRPLTPVEAAVAFAIVGSLLAVAVPAFVRNVHASRFAEPLDGVGRLAARAGVLADASPQQSAYPESAPLTPATVPRASLVTDPAGTWDHPTWRLLDFSLQVPHAYAFEFQTKNGAEVSTFSAIAHGDLDGDGVLSTFMLKGEIKPGQPGRVLPLEVIREVE